MGDVTKIQWAHHTFNPWWGCVRVSSGCEHCYAESFAKRVGQKVWGIQAPRRFFGDKHWAEPRAWDLAAAEECTRARVFCASMADVFEDREELLSHRARLFELIDETPSLDWLLLTKRPQNIMRHVPEGWRAGFPENVWLGTTAEDQQRADERIPELFKCPAVVHFISAEPLLGPLVFDAFYKGVCAACGGAGEVAGDYFSDDNARACEECRGKGTDRDNPGISWVITGGESGAGARDCRLDWLFSIVEQCRDSNVPVFVKQLGARPWDGGPNDSGERIVRLRDRKGGDIAEFPPKLQVRQFPGLGRARP